MEIFPDPGFYLAHNYPNPFNPAANLSFVIGQLSFVSLKVYGILGNEAATLVNGEKLADKYETEFNAGSLPAGVYIYTLKASGYLSANKMILLK